MGLRWRRGLSLALLATAVALVLASPASAHDDEEVGPLRLSIGWADEPAYSGLANAVEVVVSHEDGSPVTDLGGGSLAVEVTFGTETSVLALVPGGEPGVFVARLVPTQPGQYTFHVTGTATGQPIDITTACSPETFDCVADISVAQFPSKDPSGGQLSQRLDREVARAERAEDEASTARRLAIAGLAVGGLALVAAVALGLRRTRAPNA